MESVGNISTGTENLKYPSSTTLLRNLEILFFVLSFFFLGYKLFTFQHYDSLAIQWRSMPLSQTWWLIGVLTLLPLNWSLEALKWKMLTSGVQKLSMGDAVKAVLSGISTGFFTPNRVGELVGRIAFLEPGNRKAGITMSFLNSFTQNIVMAMPGIPASILFLFVFKGEIQPDAFHFVLIILMCMLIFGVLYFTLPRWSLKLKKSRFSEKIKSFTDCLSTYKPKDLLHILGVSLIRYLVFSSQFYFMLRFFSVELSPWQALISIPTTYLFVTFTPSLAFSEAVVRSSYAVLIIGAYSGQTINIALAGICIWAVNFVIPMLGGSVVIAKRA
jgi:hypothetical protein